MASYGQYAQALHMLRLGGVIAYPTEAVYGYGCDPFNGDAVDRLLDIKQRPWHKGLILIAANTAQIAPLLDPLNNDQRKQIESSWPGPVTWLLPDTDYWVPDWIRGKFTSVAVRVTNHPIAKQLCERWGGPLVSSSANRSGEKPCYGELPFRLRMQSREQRQQPDFILGGETSGLTRPSEIRDLLSGEVIRS